MTDLENLTLELDNGIATITLNRPDAANSFNLGLSIDLLTASATLAGNPEVRAVIITGNGKMFCAGGDLAYMAQNTDRMGETLRLITANLHAALATLAQMNAPVITAINGTAAGAGFSLAIAGDFAISSELAKFTMAYTGAGLAPDGSSTFHLPRLVGQRRAKELMITNRVLSAQEALDWGLLNEVVAANELADRARALAEQLAAGPTCAYGEVKRMLQASSKNGLETQMQIESNAISAMAASEDGREGVSAFLEKRRPHFKGR